MIAVWRIIAAGERSKSVRTQTVSRYKGKVHFLKNAKEKTGWYTKNK